MIGDREPIRFGPKLILTVFTYAYLVVMAIVWIRVTLIILFVIMAYSLVIGGLYLGEEFLYVILAPVIIPVNLISLYLISRFLKKFKINEPAEIVVVLAYPNWNTVGGWIKPNYLPSEIKAIARFLEVQGVSHSFYTHATTEDIEKIMRKREIRQVYFVGHGDSHNFCLTNGQVVIYCDYNDPACAKDYVHQVHCGTLQGKSLKEYVVPPENRGKCFFFNHSITGEDIVREFNKRTEEILKKRAPAQG